MSGCPVRRPVWKPLKISIRPDWTCNLSDFVSEIVSDLASGNVRPGESGLSEFILENVRFGR